MHCTSPTLLATRRALAALLTVVALIAGACASDDDAESTSAAPAASSEAAAEQTFVGKVDGSDTFVAIVTDGTRVLAYLCDGKAVWNYLDGTATATSVRAAEPGAATAIEATVSGTVVSGTVVLDDGGSPRPFTAELATGGAGFFRRAAKAEGSVSNGAWIRLPTGEVRGKELTVDVSGPGTGTTTADTSAESGITVPPDAQPVSILGLAACGIAGMRVAIATNRLNRNQTQERLEAANEAIKTANDRCGAGAAA